MNIFFLDEDPIKAARMQCDKHVSKMVLETAQMLCTVSHKFGIEAPYKAAYTKHPCTLWAGERFDNWQWLVHHGHALAREYERRYNRQHKSHDIIRFCHGNGGFPQQRGMTEPARCMPEQYKRPSVVDSYRAYYLADKANFACWTHPGKVPFWWSRAIEKVINKKGKLIYKTIQASQDVHTSLEDIS